MCLRMLFLFVVDVVVVAFAHKKITTKKLQTNTQAILYFFQILTMCN